MSFPDQKIKKLNIIRRAQPLPRDHPRLDSTWEVSQGAISPDLCCGLAGRGDPVLQPYDHPLDPMLWPSEPQYFLLLLAYKRDAEPQSYPLLVFKHPLLTTESFYVTKFKTVSPTANSLELARRENKNTSLRQSGSWTMTTQQATVNWCDVRNFREEFQLS